MSIDRALVASLQKRLDENPRSSLRVAAALRTTEFEIVANSERS
ncbi:MAG: hypothetical protein R3F34_17480 [Planctomycetota bacterium]